MAHVSYNYNATKINNFFQQNPETDFFGLKGKKIKIQHLTPDQFLEDKTPRGSTCNCLRNPDAAGDSLDISGHGGATSRSGSANCKTPRTRLCLTAGHTLSKAFTKRTWTRYESRRYGRKSAPTFRGETATPIDFLARSMTPQPIQTPLKDWAPLRGEGLREEIAHIHMGANSPRNKKPPTIYGNNTKENIVKSKYNDRFPKKAGSNSSTVTFENDRQIEIASRQTTIVPRINLKQSLESQITVINNSQKQSMNSMPLSQAYSYS